LRICLKTVPVQTACSFAVPRRGPVRGRSWKRRSSVRCRHRRNRAGPPRAGSLERALEQMIGIKRDHQLPKQALNAGKAFGGARQPLGILGAAADEDRALVLPPAESGDGVVDNALLRVGRGRTRLEIDAACLHVQEDRCRLQRRQRRLAAPLLAAGPQLVAHALEILRQHRVAVPQMSAAKSSTTLAPPSNTGSASREAIMLCQLASPSSRAS